MNPFCYPKQQPVFFFIFFFSQRRNPEQQKQQKRLLLLLFKRELLITERDPEENHQEGMQGWAKVTAAVLPAAVLLLLLAVFIRRLCLTKQRRDFKAEARRGRAAQADSFQSGITRLHLAYENGSKNLGNFHDLIMDRKPFRRGLSVKPLLFNWADYPSLITEAVEHGWSRFAFTGYNMSSSPSTRSALLGLCAPYDQARDKGVEISWEVCPGSADFMQKIRLNSGFKKANTNNNNNQTSISPLNATSVIKTALPLPGPPLGDSSFPQEAYFEITILSSKGDDDEKKKSEIECEKAKLIRESVDGNAQSDSMVHVTSNSNSGNTRADESKEESRSQLVMLSVGLSVGGAIPFKFPGTFPGSIGFNSDGSVYLDGIQLVFETGRAEWGNSETVIGCGFNPSQKKVFFTVDSELLRVIHCKSEEFSTPLYPTLAANMDVMVLVNFGQSAFKYAPANAQRTANPCFIGPLANAAPAAALGYEDSRELFSMGRIDSEWLNRCTTKSSYNNYSDKGTLDFDEESENELFEIVLDNWKSPAQTIWNKP